jgi:hypothetical protein
MSLEERLRARLKQAITQYGAACQLLSEAQNDEDRVYATKMIDSRWAQIECLLDLWEF